MIDTFATHTMSDNTLKVSESVRYKAAVLAELIMEIPNGREKSLAITKLEECVMWANKALALHGIDEVQSSGV